MAFKFKMALRLFIAGLKIMLGFLESRLLNLIDVIVSKKLAVVRFLDSGSLPLHLEKFSSCSHAFTRSTLQSSGS